MQNARIFRRIPTLASLAIALVLLVGAWPAEAQLRSQVVVSGLSQLVGYVPDPVVPGTFYVVQQSGLVRVVQNGTLLPKPFLDLQGLVSTGGEQGLLGLAFPPDATTGRVFVNFTNTAGDTVVARFRRTAANPFEVDPATRFDLRWPDGNRYIDQPYSNHNGGHLVFGPDGYLYIGLGDGGSGNDPENRAQDPNALLGKMLRIDVNVPDGDATGYQVPPDNPFLDGVPISARGEIWDFGLRNPWRYSFDDPALGGTGALFIGDVGQGAREEVDYEPRGSGARNYGWAIMEGTRENDLDRSAAYDQLTPPMLDYPRTLGIAVTGGYVYRGTALGAQYVGRYFFADYGSGRVWSVGWQPAAGGTALVTDVIEHTSELGDLGPISSFGADSAGELYIVIHSGRVLKLVPPSATLPTAASNLSAQVSERNVTLNWTGGIGATQYHIEVGSRAGVTDLLQFDTGSTATSITAVAVPDGAYYVRVRALNQAGASAASNEIVVSIGCTGPPPSPTAFSYTLSGRMVSLNWAATGDLTSIRLEVGNGPSTTDLAVFALPPSARSISGAVPPRTYYARLRAVNACGTSAPSNELEVRVP